jgi:hypothetical protein
MSFLSYVCKILYDANGHTGNTYYARFVRLMDGKIWDGTNEVLATLPNWEDSAIALVETGETGQYPIVIPAELPRGNYDVIAYLQAGSAPANTDNVALQFDTSAGSIFGF